MSVARQVSLFDRGVPDFDPRLAGLVRYDLGRGGWIDHLPGWVRGHEALFDALAEGTRWRAERRRMYARVVDVPRLVARFPDDGPGHPVLDGIAHALTAHYGWVLDRVSAALYRDGRDSVAWHGDRMGPLKPDCVMATVSVGEPRPFLLRPAGGGRSRAFRLGWGDLLVMGGSCQQAFEHSVPKIACAGPRISVMFRPSEKPCGD